MEELINLVAQKTGISPEQAKSAVETVLTHLKGRLPAPLASQVENALSGSGGGLGDVVKSLGGMFGGS